MYPALSNTILQLVKEQYLTAERKNVLNPLVDFIHKKTGSKEAININFICTHNSRRSHLAQIWAQVAASYFNIPNVNCYSGGTEETAVFPKILETLSNQGFRFFKISEVDNPIYCIKYDDNALPIIGFSKKHDSPFNPSSSFAAVMTCSQADTGCPLIIGAEKRIPITYEDPKESDGRADQLKVYFDRSLEIAAEMFYVFSQIRK